MAHCLHEACCLQLQKDVWDDIRSAQHTLQTMSLKDAVQLWQQEEHMVDKSGKKCIYMKKLQLPEQASQQLDRL